MIHLIFLLIPVVVGFDGIPDLTCGTQPGEDKSWDILGPLFRIIGGRATPPHAWPWTAALIRSGVFSCGATLVHRRYAVTAAHCLYRELLSRRANRYMVTVGNQSPFGGDIIPVSRIRIHPLFNKFFPRSFDVGIVELARDTYLPEARVAPICLPLAPPPPAKECIVAGWGRIRRGGPMSSALKEVALPIVPSWTCNDRRHYAGRIHFSMLCAGFSFGGGDACQGDSGGPLMCRRAVGGRWELGGIVSWGDGCARLLRPGVYSNVAVFAGWIRAEVHLMGITRRD